MEQRQVVYDTRGHLAELFSKAIHQGSLDALLTKEDAERLLAFLQAYRRSEERPVIRRDRTRGLYALARGGGVAPPQLRKPLGLHDLLQANFVKGEFYEDRLDWQATMLQPVGGMDRIAYRFAEKPGKPCALSMRRQGNPANGQWRSRRLFIGGRGRPQHRCRLLHLYTAGHNSARHSCRLFECRKTGDSRNAHVEPVQNRVASSPLLGTGI